MKINLFTILLGVGVLYLVTKKETKKGTSTAARPEDINLSPTTSAPAPGNVAPGTGGSTGPSTVPGTSGSANNAISFNY